MAAKTLTPEQEVAKQDAAEACATAREIKRIALAEAKIAAEQRIAESQAEADRKLARAVAVGVPKARLTTHEVMGTTNPYTLAQALSRVAESGAGVLTEPTMFSWIDKDAGILRVAYRNYPTTSLETEGYPETLRGTVQKVKDGNGWIVLEDDSDEKTEFGSLPGWLRWEVDRPIAGDRHIVGMLNAWAGENA